MLRHIDFRFSQLQGIISCKENGMYVRKNSIFTASGKKKSPNKIQNCSRSSHVKCPETSRDVVLLLLLVGRVVNIFILYSLGQTPGFFSILFFYRQKLSRIFSLQRNMQYTYFIKFFKHICQVRTANMYKCLCYTVSVFFYYIPTFTIMQCNYTYINWCINHSMFISFSY